MNRSDAKHTATEPDAEPDIEREPTVDDTDGVADTTGDEDTSTADEDTTTDHAEQPSAGALARHWIAITLTAALAVATALCCWIYFTMFRPEQQLGPDAEQAAMSAAADGATALLTYSPKTLDKDFAAAESHLTGDFLSYYTDFTQNVVTPAAKEKDVQTVASVVRKGLINLDPQKAEVLLFVNQTTISKTNPAGSYTMSSVKVGLEKHNGRWLISSFDPV